MKKISAILLFASFVLLQNSVLAASSLKVDLRANSTISAEQKITGDRVHFTVADDVKDEYGNILIQSNTQATGTITSVSPMRRIGRSAYITIDKIKTEDMEGTPVNLKAIYIEEKNCMKKSIVLGALVFPLFLLMRGPKAEISQGEIITTYTL